MKCIICGKELNKFKRKYCCPKCAQIGYHLGKATHLINTENQVRDLYSDFKKAFNVEKDRFSSLTVWKIRIFVSACYELGYTPNSIARGLKKDHATVLYHHRMATKEQKQIASDFLKNSKKYRYINKKKSVYPEGFSYK